MDAQEPLPRLDDGSAPATPEELLGYLDGLGIPHTTHRHTPVFTVEEAQALKGDLPGAHTKNLFLRDKKGVMWLVVVLSHRTVDLKAVSRTLGVSGRLSFGSKERLMRYLGVTPGAVTPFGVINDRGRAVSVALDEGLREHAIWNAHPLDNGMTTAVQGADMMRFLREVGHEPRWIALGRDD